MQTMNKLTSSEHQEIFNLIDERKVKRYDTSLCEHRRGSNFYTKWIYQFTEVEFPSNPEFWGFWETNSFVNDTEYGYDIYDIYELNRVELRTKIIEETVWVAID